MRIYHQAEDIRSPQVTEEGRREKIWGGEATHEPWAKRKGLVRWGGEGAAVEKWQNLWRGSGHGNGGGRNRPRARTDTREVGKS